MASATEFDIEEADAVEVVTPFDVDWEIYCRLRDEPANDRVRMSYLDGTLTLRSPEYVHDRGAERIGLLLRGVTPGLGLEIQGIRTTTLRKGKARRKGAGKEPDNAFYIGANERRMRRKKSLDLAIDPPPDLAIEVDHKADSSRALWFGRLAGDRYETVARSVVLSRLTPALVVEALAEAECLGESDWKPWLRAWALTLPEPAPD